VAGVGVIIFLGLLTGSYYFGKYQSGSNEVLFRNQVVELERELASFGQQRETLVLAQSQLQITGEAYGELKNALMQCDANIETVRHELAFYRSIISPEDGYSGLKIHDVEIDRIEENSFSVTAVLLQSIEHDETVAGEIYMEVVSGDDDQVIGRWPETGGKPFDLRYFEKITGQIDLPDNIVAQRIHVVVNPDGKSEDIDRWYSWHHLERALNDIAESE